MKFIFKLLLMFGLSFIFQQVFPWWTAVVVAFMVNMLFESNAKKAFFSGFIAIGCLWGIMAWYIDHQTHSILSQMIARLFAFNTPVYILFLTAFTGAFSGGIGAFCGYAFRQLFHNETEGKPLKW